jgi:hypothetical protein
MLFNLLLAASSALCPAENAEYRLHGSADVTARFYAVHKTPDWPGGLALRFHVARSGRSCWFLPWQGGTDGKTNLAWVRERDSPIQFQGQGTDIEFFAMDQSDNIASEIPKLGSAAPARLLIPGLGNLAWQSTADQNRDSIRRAFFHFAVCRVSNGPSPQIDFPAVP